MTPLTTTWTSLHGQALQRGLLLTAALLLPGLPPARALPIGGELVPVDLQRLGPLQQRDYFLSLRRLEDQRHERQLALQSRSEWCYRGAAGALAAIRRCWAADERAAAALSGDLAEERRRLDQRFALLARGPAGPSGGPLAAAEHPYPGRYPSAYPSAYPSPYPAPAYGQPSPGGWSGWPRPLWP
ncbi:MAG: hypothetical protein ACKOPN_11265 [Prochlorococcaceae cyanobacterium]